jgi:hypothetical protein
MSKRTAEIDLSATVIHGKRAKMDENMNVETSEQGAVKIDEDLHSRQLAVYGRESFSRMANANVLILGLKGLGVEVGAVLTQSACPACGALHLESAIASLARCWRENDTEQIVLPFIPCYMLHAACDVAARRWGSSRRFTSCTDSTRSFRRLGARPPQAGKRNGALYNP